MDKLLPKDFVLWRAYLLLLLISTLEVVFACNGGIGWGRGVEAPKQGGYGDYCNEETPCHDAFQCDDQECDCPNHITFKLTLFYDKKQGKCLSGVGKLCSLESKANDGLWKVECVPYADCVRPKGDDKLSTLFGVCKCAETFAETEDHLCKPAMGFQVGNGDPIMSMTNVGGMVEGGEGLSPKTPVEVNMDGDEVGESSKEDDLPVTSSISSDAMDLNDHLVVHKVKVKVRDDRTPSAHHPPFPAASASSAGENVKWLTFLTVSLYTALLCAQI